LSGHGLALHERMALVRAADAYVGSFDELGCTALISGRPAMVVDGSAAGRRDRLGRGGVVAWFLDPLEPEEALMQELLKFLSRWDDERTRLSCGSE
jgi:hypothetical protein